MSDNSPSHASAGEEEHTGPIKNPKQLLIAVVFSFVVPVFAIIGLVYFVASSVMPASRSDSESMALSGMSEDAREKGIAARLQKVGSVEIRDANRVMRSGEEVFKGQCTACHTAGVAGAPKFGDAAAWAPRIKTGYEALLTSALKGKGAMSAQGGGEYDDREIANAVVYMANAGGAKFEAPKAAAPAADAAAPAASAAATPAPMAAAPAAAPAVATTPAAATVVAAAPVEAKPATVAGGNGEALYKQVCTACHAAGVAGAPKFGDKAAWAPRIKTGIDALVASAIKGKGAMPPKGGSQASEAEIRATVEYMVNAAK